MKNICLLVLLLAVTPLWGQKGKNLNLIFIGNSISAGAQLKDVARECPPARACEYLRTLPGVGLVAFSNQAVSGRTTADFLPAFNTLFPKVIAAADLFAADTAGQLIFSVMLGTNDSAIKGPNGSPVAPKQYQTNLSVLIDRLLSRYPSCVIVLHRPLWYSENAYNNGAMYLKEGLARLEKYYPELQALAAVYAETAPGRVFVGDTGAFDHFRDHAPELFIHEKGNAGIFYLHPNREGAASLGQFWGKAIYSIVDKK